MSSLCLTAPGVSVCFSQRDLAQDAFRKWILTMTPDEPSSSSSPYSPTGYPMDISTLVAAVPSPSGKLIACVRVVDKKGSPPGPNSKSWVIEIMTRRQILFSVNTEKQHGRVYTGVPFGTLSWSPQEDAIVYVAENLPPTHQSLWEDTAVGLREVKGSDKKDPNGNNNNNNINLTGNKPSVVVSEGQSSSTTEGDSDIHPNQASTTATSTSSSSSTTITPTTSTLITTMSSSDHALSGPESTAVEGKESGEPVVEKKPEWIGTSADYVADWGEQLNGIIT